MAVEPGEGASAGGAAAAPAAANGHAPPGAAAAGSSHVKKNSKQADKKKEKKAKYKQNKQQRRQQQQAAAAADQPAAAAAAAAARQDDDVVIEYVPAPAPDLADLLQQVLPSSSKQRGGGSEPAAAADGDGLEQKEQEEEEEDGEQRGGLGLGAAAGLGLGFQPASGEQQQEAAAAAAASEEDVMEQFKRVLERFMPADDDDNDEAAAGGSGDGGEQAAAAGGEQGGAKKAGGGSDSGSGSDEEGEGGGEGGDKMSKKQRKHLNQLRVAALKQKCNRPDVVEVWDVTAQDPETLVAIKAMRNTVPVPRHWSQKRKYLSGKLGIEKPPFRLPEFIEATGITEMRNAYAEKEESKKLKQKQRDRMTAKTGKMDISYEVLYDAFFKHQRKPKMSGLGELYYEGREYEASLEHLRPGVLSEELRTALAMDPGGPPPWLVNMQRYGPPPSYPSLKVPGLNAPIPPGGQFGYQPGGWGKPPVDAAGNAMYGDVFGVAGGDDDSDEEVDKAARWGVVEELEESSEEEEEEDEEAGEGDEEEGYEDMSGIATDATGLASSLQSGLETPDVALNLRKTTDSVAGTESAQAPQLYTVLEQRQAAVGGGLMGTDHVYVMPGQEGGGAGGAGGGSAAAGGKRRPGGADVEVTLTPEELEGLDEAGIKALYESKLAAAAAAAGAAGGREDFSDLVAGHAAAQKRKLAAKADARAAKKQKDSFKF